MSRTTARERQEVTQRLLDIGIKFDDVARLRRIGMTLQRWFELECGDGNEYGAWAIERDNDGEGPPYMVHHHYLHGRGKDYTTRTKIADREQGARKRLAKVIERYPQLTYYVQTDPRGASLYILRMDDTKDYSIEQIYNRGVAVY